MCLIRAFTYLAAEPLKNTFSDGTRAICHGFAHPQRCSSVAIRDHAAVAVVCIDLFLQYTYSSVSNVNTAKRYSCSPAVAHQQTAETHMGDVDRR